MTETHPAGEYEARFLFIESDNQGTLDTSDDLTIIRTRFVDINFDLLEGAEVGDALILNLFDDVIYTAILDRVEATNADGYSWVGHLEGTDHSELILIVGGGQMAGNVTLPGAAYQVRFAGNGVHAIYGIDQSAFPPEDEPGLPDE